MRGMLVSLASLLLVLPGSARADTVCTFGGASPGYAAMRLDLPQGSDLLVLRIDATRAQKVANDENSWHLAQGIVVLDDANVPVAYSLSYQGTVAADVVIHASGDGARVPVRAPEGPFAHSARTNTLSLPAGSYTVVSFGAGGSASGSLAQRWQTSIDVDGAHDCDQQATGSTFDIDQTRMTGDAQIYVPGAGVARGISASSTAAAPLVVGLVDSAVQGPAGDVSTCVTTPDASLPCIGHAIVPVVGGGGGYSVAAQYTGAFPIVGFAGVALDPSTLGDTP